MFALKVVSLAAMVAVAQAAVGKPKGTFFIGSDSGLSADDLAAGAEVDVVLTDDATVGGTVMFGSDEVKPVSAWVRYMTNVNGFDTTAKATYAFGDSSTAVDVDMQTSVGFVEGGKTNLGASFGSKVRGFLSEVRASQDITSMNGKASTMSASYNVPTHKAAASVYHKMNGGDTAIEAGWKQEGNAASLKVSQKVSGVGGVITPEVDLRSGEFKCEFCKGDLENTQLVVDVASTKMANFLWTDKTNQGAWKTSGAVPLDNWKSSSLSFRREWSF